MDPGISFSQNYAIWDAAVRAGATLDELLKLFRGEYPHDFIAHVLMYVGMSRQIENHTQAAIEKKSRKNAPRSRPSRRR